MSFDFRPKWASLHDVGQVNEGGYNRFNACIPTTVHEIMEALTGVHIPPQAYTDFEAGTTFKGYTQLGWSVDFVQKHYPNPPVMSIINPDDTFAYVNQMGAMGWAVALLFHIDNSVTIGSRGSGFHCSPPLASDGVNWIAVRNVWREGWIQEFDKAGFNAACSGSNAGTMIVFHAPIPQSGGTLTSQEADAIRTELRAELDAIKAAHAGAVEQLTAADALLFAMGVKWDPLQPNVYSAIEKLTRNGVQAGSFRNLFATVQQNPSISAGINKEAAE